MLLMIVIGLSWDGSFPWKRRMRVKQGEMIGETSLGLDVGFSLRYFLEVGNILSEEDIP